MDRVRRVMLRALSSGWLAQSLTAGWSASWLAGILRRVVQNPYFYYYLHQMGDECQETRGGPNTSTRIR